MIALLLAARLFAQDATAAFAARVGAVLGIPDAAVKRSLQPIGDKAYVTIKLVWRNSEKCVLTTWPCRGQWTAEHPKQQFPPSSFIMAGPLFEGYPTYLLYVAVDRHDRPVWLGSGRDFRLIEVPPSRDGKVGFSGAIVDSVEGMIDIPNDAGAVRLRIYSPVSCDIGPCFEHNGTVRLPVLP